MTDWLLFIGYWVGWLSTCWVIFPRIIDDVHGVPDAMDKALAAFLTGLVSLFWPLMIPFGAMYLLVRGRSDNERDAELHAREDALLERERRIAELERDLNIRKEDR